MKNSHNRVYVYDEPRAAGFDIKKIKIYVEEKTGFEVCVRPAIFDFVLSLQKGEEEKEIEKWAQKLAQAKVRNLSRPSSFVPLKGEIDYEKNRLMDSSTKVFGLLYDGFKLVSMFFPLLALEEQDSSHIHIIFTNQLVGTWDPESGRYHGRVAIYGFPSIISTTGIVEAPAKPKEYYWLKQSVLSRGINPQVLEEFKRKHQKEFLDHGDARLTEALKGYVLQAILYRFEGKPFCQDPDCRLFNAHWQKELIRAQLGGEYELCPKHQKLFKNLKG